MAFAKLSRRVPVLLVILPLWLLASGGGAMWYYFHREKQQALVEQERFSKNVSAPLLADDLRKIVEVIGERNASSETAATNLSRTASMIEGVLGPSNTGYPVKKTHGPAKWPILQVTLIGKDPGAAPVWVVTSYDSRQGSKGAEANATGLAATLAAAQALARDKPNHPVHFIFLPHSNDVESSVLQTATKFHELAKLTGKPHALLCVEAMGAGETLWLTSRDVSAAPLGRISGLGAVYGAEVVCLRDDTDLASMLFEMDLPAVRVATRAQLTDEDEDDRLPFAPTVAASTGRLIELIRRCAEK
ncbi:MAG: M28 family peptidase [Luteolibacter sp.]|uniref:M28 family peptidase n=1 Tax=Luteolibacter sp. TaxID=1962973 RepID=UPI003267561D